MRAEPFDTCRLLAIDRILAIVFSRFTLAFRAVLFPRYHAASATAGIPATFENAR